MPSFHCLRSWSVQKSASVVCSAVLAVLSNPPSSLTCWKSSAYSSLVRGFGPSGRNCEPLSSAERAYREGIERAARAGDRGILDVLAYTLGRLLDERGDHDEPGRSFLIPEKEIAHTAADQVFWRSARARELARRGQIEEAVRLAGQAVALARRSDNLHLRCSPVEDLVHVLRAAGRPGEAIPLVEELVRLRERKGEPIAAAKARSLLEQLRAPAVV
jgi:hypothetical protein